MKPIHFEINGAFFAGHTNGHWMFAARTENKDTENSKKFDIAKIPLDKLVNKNDDLLVLPETFDGRLLRDIVASIKCNKCNDTGDYNCPACHGRGVKFCDCKCGNSHTTKCIECFGRGCIACNSCPSIALQQNLIKIDKLIVNEALLLELLCKVPWNNQIYATTTDNILLCRSGAYIMVLMAVEGKATPKYKITLDPLDKCIDDRQHCWHLTSGGEEKCCWCGKQRVATPHGAFYKPVPENGDFVF